MSGTKYDQDKLRYDLMPTEALEEVVRVFTAGAKKYADRNWEKGIQFGRLIAAANRHEAAFKKGELVDPETKTLHLANEVVNLMMMIQFILTNRAAELDNLPNSFKRYMQDVPSRDQLLELKREDEALDLPEVSNGD